MRFVIAVILFAITSIVYAFVFLLADYYGIKYVPSIVDEILLTTNPLNAVLMLITLMSLCASILISIPAILFFMKLFFVAIALGIMPSPNTIKEMPSS